MNRVRHLAFVFGVCLAAAMIAAPALGQDNDSYDYPPDLHPACLVPYGEDVTNVDLGDGGSETAVLVPGPPANKVTAVPNHGECDNGDVASRRTMQALCLVADAMPQYTCQTDTGSTGWVAGCQVNPDAISFPSSEVVWCQWGPHPRNGFVLYQANLTSRLLVSPPSGGRQNRGVALQDIDCVHQHGTDLLPQVLIRVDPNGDNTVVSFEVCEAHDEDCASPLSFSVDPSLFGSDLALHNAIAAEIVGLGLGLLPEVLCTPEDLEKHAMVPELFLGCFVRVANADDLTSAWRVEGGAAQINSMETSVLLRGIPTLSAFGIALLAIVLMTALYFLRRRRQQLET